MDDTVLTALLCAAVAVLSGAVLYQRIVLQAQMRQSLEEMTAVLGRVLDGESGEQVMVFTQDQALTGLIARSTGCWRNGREGGRSTAGRSRQSGVCSPTSPTISEPP